jgi:YidC/Oxa1 family membrane protein insertase
MKFDRATIGALVLCLAFLLVWPHIVKKLWPNAQKPIQQIQITTEKKEAETVQKESKTLQNSVQQSQNSETQTKSLNSGKTLVSKIKKEVKKLIPESTSVKKLPIVTLKNEFITVFITPNSGEISSIILNKHTLADKKNNIELMKDIQCGALSVTPVDTKWTLLNVNVKKENSGTPQETVIVKRDFRGTENELFSITQKWSIKENYSISYTLKITNKSDKTLTLKNIAVSAGGIEKITELAGDKVFRENHEIDYYSMSENKLVPESAATGGGFMAMFTGGSKNQPKTGFNKTVNEKAKWIGVTNKYFTSLLIPEQAFNDGLILRSVILKNKDKKDYVMAEAAGLLNFESIEPGESQIMKFTYFAGPKKIKLLNKLDPDASKIMKLYMLGMRFLEPVSRLMLNVLMWLKNWCGSYGLSIILLTLIVKTLFWPITHRANVSMRKMQKIQPLIKELRKKYKDKPQQVNTEMMKLYKEHKVNPLGGCLPILLQMPVFFALYATLSGSIEPRHTAFLWMHDLSMPDTVAHIFGLPINPLMLMMTITMILQQKLTPSAADPAQQKMMMFMPLIMLVMLYSLPSGLTLYWTVSQFISIAQLLVNKQIEKRAELKEAGA